jgi:AbrB family looped-hinge helix DNA binding protein
MNEVLYMDKGRVTIPKECRKRHGLEDGSTLLFFETKSGALVLKPVKAKPELDLVDHLRKFKGIEIPGRKHICPPRV